MTTNKRAILCRSCGKLISAGVSVCPHCGARSPGVLASNSKMARTLNNIEPVQLVIGFCVLLYLGAVAFNPAIAFESSGGLFSLGSPDMRVQVLLGASGGPSWYCGYYWTLLTANFLHGSALHILFNMLWLRSLGPITSQIFGPTRFFVIFMITGMAGFALSGWGEPFLYSMIGEPFSPIPPPTLGASASIFGLMGVLVGWGRQDGSAFAAQLTRQMLTWAIALFVLGLVMSGINNLAHLGGFIGGYCMSHVLPPQRKREVDRFIKGLAIALAVLTLVGMALSFMGWSHAVFGDEPLQCKLR